MRTQQRAVLVAAAVVVVLSLSGGCVSAHSPTLLDGTALRYDDQAVPGSRVLRAVRSIPRAELGNATLAEWPAGAASPCVTGATLEYVLQSVLDAAPPSDRQTGANVATAADVLRVMAMRQDDHWRPDLLGEVAAAANGTALLQLEELADHHEALLALQLFTLLRARESPEVFEKLPQGLRAVADAASALLSPQPSSEGRPPLRSASIAALAQSDEWRVTADNVTVGFGASAEHEPFDPRFQEERRAVLVPRIVAYHVQLLRQRGARIARAIANLDTFVVGRLSLRQDMTDAALAAADVRLLRRIHARVVTPHFLAARSGAPRMWCAFAPFILPTCDSPNTIVDVAADGAVLLKPTREIVGGCDAVRLCPDATATAVDAALLRGFYSTGSRAIRVTASQDAACAKDRVIDHSAAVDQRYRKRQRPRPSSPGGTASPDRSPTEWRPSEGRPSARDAFAFDTHMEMTPTPVAVARGCLAAPLAVAGADGRAHPLLRDCLVIQQLPRELQAEFRARLTGNDLTVRVDYHRFLAAWLGERLAMNYSMPAVRTRERGDEPEDTLEPFVASTVVPQWCAAATEGDVCDALRLAQTFLADARAVLQAGIAAATAEAEKLEADMERLTPDVARLYHERARTMTPLERIAQARGSPDCHAAMCGGHALNRGQQQQPKQDSAEQQASKVEDRYGGDPPPEPKERELPPSMRTYELTDDEKQQAEAEAAAEDEVSPDL